MCIINKVGASTNLQGEGAAEGAVVAGDYFLDCSQGLALNLSL